MLGRNRLGLRPSIVLRGFEARRWRSSHLNHRCDYFGSEIPMPWYSGALVGPYGLIVEPALM